MADHEKKLDDLFAGTGIKANKVLGTDPQEGSICLEYLEGRTTLEERALSLIREGCGEEAFGLIRTFCGKIEALAVSPFEYTDEFGAVFGMADYPF